MVTEDLIIKLSKLQQQDISKFDKFKNPLLSLISSRWYFSDCERLFQDVELNWESCEKSDFVSSIANKINEFNISTFADSSFELSLCSWYQPYHYTPRDRWGVHIRYGSWKTISAGLNRKCPNLNDNHVESVKAAFFYLYIHELFHYLIENVSTIMEIEYNDPLIYINYLGNIYCKVFNTSECLEEALANSYLLERSNLCHINKEYLKEGLLSQGEGYNDFLGYANSKFNFGLRKLISYIEIKHSDSHSNSKLMNSLKLFELFFNVSYIHNVPIWLHQTPLRTYAN